MSDKPNEHILPDSVGNVLPDSVNSGINQAASGAKDSYAATSHSVDKASTAIKNLVSGEGNIVDAAMAVKGAIDSVKGFSRAVSASVMMPVMKGLAAFKGQAILPAAKQMDPVMGIDVHMVTIPPSPAPVPMPHPYVGMLFNSKDWMSCFINSIKKKVLSNIPTPAEDDKSNMASIARNKDAIAGMIMAKYSLNASVKFGGFVPRAVTGTPVKSIPHIPMGAGFHPAFEASVAKNHGKAFLGSLFVAADGDPMVGAFHLNYDCWDIGVVDLFKGRRKAKSPPGEGESKAQLYVPSGTVMPIPWGKPVLVNSIPTPVNPLGIADLLFKKMAKWGLAKLLHAVVRNTLPPGSRVADAAHKAICQATGHPVDVASGMLFTDEEDFSLTGVIPFSFERTWYSDSIYKGPLGHGWHHQYDVNFTVENNTGIFRTNDGKVVGFELPEPGKFSFDRTTKLFLHCHKEDKYYYIADKDGLIYRFTEKVYFNPYHKTNCQLLQSISNANGYAIRFEHNEKAELIKITDSAGRILIIENDDSGRITSIHAPHPEEYDKTFIISKYEYDSESNMICHTDSLGKKMLYEYHNRLLVKETWRDGQQWYFEYDGNQPGAKCIHTWGDGNIYNHKLTYLQGVTVVENSLGHKTTYHIKGRLISKKIDGNGAKWEYNYNRNDELEWETDPLGNQQTYLRDQWGNIAGEMDAAGGFSQTEFSSPPFSSLPAKAVDKEGGKWKWNYDGSGNLKERVNPLGAKTEYAYEDGLLVKIKNPLGAITELKYDREQNLTEIKTDDGSVTNYSYDMLGNCVKVTNPNGQSQHRAYNLKSRIIRVNDFDGNDIRLEYDGIDNVIRYKDKQKEVRYSYSGLWKLTGRNEGGATIYFEYDTEEQLRKVINEHKLPYIFELDAVGNVTKEIGFGGITRSYERNPAGWVTKINRPGEKFTNYSYDEVGRVTGVKYSDNKTENYSYNNSGGLIVATNDAAKVLLEKDVLGNIIKETTNGEWIISEYDIVGNRIKTTSSLGADISHEFNKMGDVLQMTANGWQAKFFYDKLGLEVERLLPGNINSRWERDEIGRPLAHTVGHSAGVNRVNKRHRKYTWDVNDRLKQIADSNGVTRFEHDQWSNLAKTTYPNGEQQWRNPDEVGNLFKTLDRSDRSYAKGGQLRKANGWNYSYDGEGNLIEKKHIKGDTWKYDWSDAGMLTKVTRPDKAEVTFIYDALGRRLAKRYKNTATKFLWNGNVPLHEWKENAITMEKLSDIKVGENGITTWLFDTDSFAPAGKIKGDKKYSVVSDHLGTPAQMYKEDGTLFWDCELDSYGKVRIEKGELGSCSFRYQGQYEDVETGLYYNRFRYYAIEEGIYISQDPIGLWGGKNLYNYVKDLNIQLDKFGLYSKRREYLGNTPGKNSKTGRKVRERMRSEGRLRDGVDGEEFLNRSTNTWHPISEADMGHRPVDAVTYWNETGRNYGARSDEVRAWMRDPDNYELQHFSTNRSSGAQLTERYQPPVE